MAIILSQTLRQPNIETGEVITRELIEVFFYKSALTINWYYRFDHDNILPFTGHYIISGDVAYFYLYNEKYKGRMRILVTPDMFWKQPRISNTFGMLLTQMPFVEDRTLLGLVSRKVCIRRMDVPSLKEKDIADIVRRIGVEEMADHQYALEVHTKLFKNGAAGLDI